MSFRRVPKEAPPREYQKKVLKSLCFGNSERLKKIISLVHPEQKRCGSKKRKFVPKILSGETSALTSGLLKKKIEPAQIIPILEPGLLFPYSRAFFYQFCFIGTIFLFLGYLFSRVLNGARLKSFSTGSCRAQNLDHQTVP